MAGARRKVGGVWMTWRAAMQAALYGPGGFYARGEPPARHFRTSVHVSPRYAAAIWELLRQVDAGLGHPGRIDLVDIGAGRGELLEQVLAAAAEPGATAGAGAGIAADPEAAAAGPGLAGRIAACAVELAPRPAGLDPRIGWQPTPPAGITGLVIASEWLDNIPLDVVELTAAGPALVLVDPATGAERAGCPPGPADLAWLPDGSRDITAHVALDACATAGTAAGASESVLITQRAALRGLGLHARRPSLALAATDPERYARALGQASVDEELVDPEGLGGFGWLVQAVGTGLPAPLARLATPGHDT